MKRSSLLPTVFLLFHLAVHCQQDKTLVSFPNRSDSSKVRYLLAIAKKWEDRNFDSAVYYDQKAMALAYSLKNITQLEACMRQQMEFLNKQGKFEDALNFALQHIKMSEQLKSSPLMLRTYNEAANEYEYLGDYESATEYYLKSLRMATALGDRRLQRKINNNLGSVFIALKDYGTGYSYASRGYEMAREDRDTETMANCMVNMGVAELNRKKYQEALLHFDQAKTIGYRIPDMSLVADALSDKGLAYLSMHDLKAAAASYGEQKFIADKYNLPYEKFYALFQLALVEKEKKNFKKANDYASRAIAIGENLGTADELMEMYDSMSVIKQNLGDLQAALLYKNKFVTLNDSLRNQQVQTNIHHLNIQYRSAQKDKQIAEQNLNIERNSALIERKNIGLFVSMLALVALGSILVLSIRSYRNKQKLHQQEMLTLQKEFEVNTLKAKMQAREEERNRIAREMHDEIGSALTSILYLSGDLKTQNKAAASATADRIAESSSSVVDKMNEIIWSMNPEYDSLVDLIAYTRRHCAEFLGDHGISYEMETSGINDHLPLSGEQRRNIYLVIKEALHNVVKHSMASKVKINFHLDMTVLQVTICDNGKGINNENGFGNGLANMRYRMQVIGGKFEIKSDRGTTVDLHCPIHKETLSPV